MHQEYLAEKFWSNYVVSLMLVPTHENVPGNVFKWQKMSERQTNAGNLQNLTLSTCWNFFVFMSMFKSHSLNLTLSHTLSLSPDMLNNWKHFTAIALKISFCTKNVQWSMLTWNPEVRVTFWLPTKLGPSREVRIIGLAFICVPCHTVLSWEPEDFSIIIMSESTK